MPILLRRLLRPEPKSLSVRHGERSFEVELRRSASATRMTLRVSGATRRVTLTIPDRARLGTAQSFAERQGGWISERLSALPGRLTFEAGAMVPLRDVPHRIVHPTAGRGLPRTALDGAGPPVLLVPGEPDAVPGRVRRFLVAEAGRDLRHAVDRHTRTLGVKVSRITVRDTRSRWGSCSSAGTLNFSWRLIMAPPFVLDYLAAHEVAHLRELNHSDRFWALLRDLYPETDAAERWLKRHGAALHRYG